MMDGTMIVYFVLWGGGRTLAAFLLDFHSSELEEKAPSPSSSLLLHRCLGAAAA